MPSESNGTNGQAIAPAQQPKRLTIADLLTQKKDALADVATKFLTPEKLVKMIGVQMARTPNLAKCDPRSVLNCAMTLAELGLAPGTLGEAYLIPFKDECTLIIGYRGLMKLALRSGELSSITARLVYRQDTFEIEYGSTPKIVHKPAMGHGNKDEDIVGAYMIARYKDAAMEPVTEYMTRDQIIKVKNRSRASGSGPWVSDFGEMCRKTVVRRGAKYLPLTTETLEAIEVADRTEFDFQTAADGTQIRNPDANMEAAKARLQAARLAAAESEANEQADREAEANPPEKPDVVAAAAEMAPEPGSQDPHEGEGEQLPLGGTRRRTTTAGR